MTYPTIRKCLARRNKITYISGNVSRDITTLSLNDRKSSQRSSTEVVVHLGSTLKQSGVKVENVTGVGLTTGRTTKKQRHLTVGDSLFRQVVVDDQSYNVPNLV